MRKKRLIIDQRIGSLSFFDILDDNTPDNVIAEINKIKQEYKDRDIYFKVEYYGYDGGCDLNLHERRLENDEEYNMRLADEKKMDKQRKNKQRSIEEKERAEFERLKRKFQK